MSFCQNYNVKDFINIEAKAKVEVEVKVKAKAKVKVEIKVKRHITDASRLIRYKSLPLIEGFMEGWNGLTQPQP